MTRSSANCPSRRIWTPKAWTSAPAALEELLAVSASLWRTELEGVGAYLEEFGNRVPQALKNELEHSLAKWPPAPPPGTRL